MEAKPMPRVYWTNKHRKHDMAGVLVIGRQVIPLVLVYIFLSIVAVGLLFYGITVAPKHPTEGYITDGTSLIPLLYLLIAVGSVFAVIGAVKGLRAFFRYVKDVLKEARDGLDTGRGW
ncbi:membrane protein [Microbacterium phage Zooman]|nr:membrane protein [Microbacterium phage Zooman]